MYTIYKAVEVKKGKKSVLKAAGKPVIKTNSLSYLNKRLNQLTFNTILRYE